MRAEEYLEKKRIERIEIREKIRVIILIVISLTLLYIISITDSKPDIVFMSGILWKCVSIVYNEVGGNK